MTDEPQRPGDTEGRRTAGGLMLANAGILTAAWLWVEPLKLSPLLPPLHAVLGYLLVRGRGAMAVPALIAFAAGLIFAVLRSTPDTRYLLVLPALMVGGFVLLLAGDAGRARRVAGVLLFALYALAMAGAIALHNAPWD
jgi:hypothetical protein